MSSTSGAEEKAIKTSSQTHALALLLDASKGLARKFSSRENEFFIFGGTVEDRANPFLLSEAPHLSHRWISKHFVINELKSAPNSFKVFGRTCRAARIFVEDEVTLIFHIDPNTNCIVIENQNN